MRRMRVRTGWIGVAMGGALLVGLPVHAQELEAVVERARSAWLSHSGKGLVETSDTVRLRLPGVAVSAAVRPGQAARLLGEYFADAAEKAFVLRGIRSVSEDHAYAEFGRQFSVRGTSELKEETVFFGFRRVDGEWRLREVRVAP